MIVAGTGGIDVSEEEVSSLTGMIREAFSEVKILCLDLER